MEIVETEKLNNISETKISSAVVVCEESSVVEKKTCSSGKRVLDEETYTEEVEKIIERDFFPDLKKLKAQNDYLEALESNDIAKLQEIQIKYRPKTGTGRPGTSLSGIFNTPSTFETPEVDRDGSPSRKGSRTIQESNVDSSGNSTKNVRDETSLDHFLNQYTSEDNASFEVIMQKADTQHQLKYPWLYKDENEEQKKVTDLLTLPSSENQAIKEKPSNGVITWAYKNKNALMYVPDGAELTAEERLIYEKREEILYPNTRFAAPPFDEQANKLAIAEAASVQAKMKEGKVGIDGKEILPDESPKVNGYGFVATPSPAPGITDSPIMTWGEIEGTPFRLDGSDTPLPQNPSGQQFKIPEIPARERIALSLADKAAKQHRVKKQDAMKQIHSHLLSPSLRVGTSGTMTPLERLHSMSPAAQRLACAKLGIHRDTDKALRASYSPSPLHSPFSDRTPVVARTPTNETPTESIRKRTVDTPSLTDNLLNLPKRNRAKDFF